LTRPKQLACSLAILLQVVLTPVAASQGDPKLESLRIRAEAYARPYADLIEAHAGDVGIDPALVVAVIAVESKGDPNAYSSSGAMGLMQLMPATCQDYGVADPYEPSANIRAGASLLANHLGRYRGDLQKTLAAYNAGPRRVDDGSWQNIRETRRYVPSVLAYYAALRPGGDGWAPSPTAPTAPLPQPITPPIRVLDTMFAAVQASQSQIEPAGVAENGTLHDAAAAVMSDFVSGKVALRNVPARTAKWLASNSVRPKSLKTFVFTTAEADGFAAAWAKQEPAPGRFVGLAHGTNRSGHVWLVILANLE